MSNAPEVFKRIDKQCSNKESGAAFELPIEDALAETLWQHGTGEGLSPCEPHAWLCRAVPSLPSSSAKPCASEWFHRRNWAAWGSELTPS